ncbi:MAG: asparaginase domain-containing protein [Pseudomonadota bacterium]
MSLSYHTTGEVPLGDHRVYVRRPLDDAFAAAIERLDRNKILMLYGCRQMGKSSLALRAAETMRQKGRVIEIDLREASVHGEADPGPFTFASKLAMCIARAIGRGDDFETWWSARYSSPAAQLVGNTAIFKDFLLEFLPASDGPTTIFIDEFDRVLAFRRTWEFLLDVTYDITNKEVFAHLKLVLIGLNRPVDLATGPDLPKYEQFEYLRVSDFVIDDPQVIDTFAEGLIHLGDPLLRRAITGEVLLQTGGQPFVTNVILEHIVSTKTGSVNDARALIADLVSVWRFGRDRKRGERPIHFDQPEKILLEFDALHHRSAGAFQIYEALLNNLPAPDADQRTAITILATGLVVDTAEGLRLRSPVYRGVFDSAWLDMMRRVVATAPPAGTQRRPIGARALPRVLVLNLGGTLGMAVDPDGRLVSPEDPQAFFRNIPNLSDLIDPIVETPIARPTDGANIVPADWVSVARMIHEYRALDIAGVLVVAGTDTMAYLASAVAFALGQSLPFPVVFTGAQAPVTKLHGDAQANILRAALVAKAGADKLREVVIVFNDAVLRAVCTEKVDDYRFAAFAAPIEGPIATIGEELHFQLGVRAGNTAGQSLSSWELRAEFEESVFKLSQYPGFDPDFLEALLDTGRVKGLLIESLGLGNVPVVGRYSLLPAIEKARDRDIPVLITGRYPIQPEFIEFYQPAAAPLQRGAISAGNMTSAAALTKFMWAIRSVDNAILRRDIPASARMTQIAGVMETNYLGERGRQKQT